MCHAMRRLSYCDELKLSFASSYVLRNSSSFFSHSFLSFPSRESGHRSSVFICRDKSLAHHGLWRPAPYRSQWMPTFSADNEACCAHAHGSVSPPSAASLPLMTLGRKSFAWLMWVLHHVFRPWEAPTICLGSLLFFLLSSVIGSGSITDVR